MALVFSGIPVPAAAETPSGETPAVASALAKAKQTDKQVAVPDETTEYAEVVANPDGTLTRTESFEPQRVRRGDTWVPVDLTLAARSDGTIGPKTAPVDVRLSDGGTGEILVAAREGAHERGRLRLRGTVGHRDPLARLQAMCRRTVGPPRPHVPVRPSRPQHSAEPMTRALRLMTPPDGSSNVVLLRPQRQACDCGSPRQLCPGCGRMRCTRCDPRTSDACLPPGHV
ncbi:hypothetical protein F9C11_26810 [Amycolatopsis sp. VS8301801F10]|uniref:hypothetical protein n=1 Tax=Amycolatopsis sp. VS8301801F10 TaxID=2652442 RepID=UPI0038FCE9D7